MYVCVVKKSGMCACMYVGGVRMLERSGNKHTNIQQLHFWSEFLYILVMTSLLVVVCLKWICIN